MLNIFSGSCSSTSSPALYLIILCVCESYSARNCHNQLKHSNLKNLIPLLRDFLKYEINYRLIRLSLKTFKYLLNYQSKIGNSNAYGWKADDLSKWKSQVRLVTPKTHVPHRRSGLCTQTKSRTGTRGSRFGPWRSLNFCMSLLNLKCWLNIRR